MIIKNFWQTAQISPSMIDAHHVTISTALNALRTAHTASTYATPYAFIRLPDDTTIEAIALEQAAGIWGACDTVVVVGIGGSALGTMGVYQALQGVFFNDRARKKLYIADTVDPDYISSVLAAMEADFKQGKKVAVLVISKSGTTMETNVNFALCKQLYMRYYPDEYHRYVMVVTDKESPLWQVAQDKKYACYEIPAMVGGRYSVFSTVGSLPLVLLDMNITAWRQGARAATTACLSNDMVHNPAVLGAIFLYEWYTKGVVIHDNFFFSQQCALLGAWYRQLIAESLGKVSHDGVPVGITPTTSIGTVDLHSMVQLYLGGPLQRTTSFISIEEYTHDRTIGSDGGLFAGATLQKTMQAIYGGTVAAYAADKRPYVEIVFPQLDAYTIGNYMQTKLCEIVILGHLLQVNPFDQPQVEIYKQHTREIVSI